MTKQNKPVPDHRNIFRLAERYAEASKILEKQQAQAEGYQSSAPMLTLDALAVELYLKCLYVQDHNRRPPEEHNFKKLFHSLKDGTRAAIRHQFDDNINHDKVAKG